MNMAQATVLSTILLWIGLVIGIIGIAVQVQRSQAYLKEIGVSYGKLSSAGKDNVSRMFSTFKPTILMIVCAIILLIKWLV